MIGPMERADAALPEGVAAAIAVAVALAAGELGQAVRGVTSIRPIGWRSVAGRDDRALWASAGRQEAGWTRERFGEERQA